MIHPAVLSLNNTGDHYHMPSKSEKNDADEMMDKTRVHEVLWKAGIEISPEV